MTVSDMNDSENVFLLDDSASQQMGIAQLLDYAWGVFKRQWWIIGLSGVLALSLGVLYLRTTPPTYTARVDILFQNPKTEFIVQQSILADQPFDNAQLETQIQLLRSRNLALAVINQLNLKDDPDFNPANLTIWKRLRLLLVGRSKEPVAESGDPDAIIDAFEGRLSVGRVDFSMVIQVEFNASDAERAAEIANAIANAYIHDQINAKSQASKEAASWLEDRMRELSQRAIEAEREVTAFESQNNIVAAGGKLMDEQQVADLNNSLTAAQIQTTNALTRVNQFEAILKGSSPDSEFLDSLDAFGSDVPSDPIIISLRERYLELARRETDWSKRFGANHSAVVNLRARMKDIRTSVLDEVRRLEAASKNALELAKRRQQEIESQLAAAVARSREINTAEITAQELRSNAKEYRTVFQSYLQRFIGQQSSFPIPTARVISPASPPNSKSKPKSTLIIALSLLGGLSIGGALGLLRDLLDRAFRTAYQAERVLAASCLALVPRVRPKKQRQISHRMWQTSLKNGDPAERFIHTSGIYWAATAMPRSRFTESIRAIRLAVDLYPTKSENKIIGITSTVPNEGKSTIAASLAQLLGQSGKRVIVVDCDLRNPTLSANLAAGAKNGVVDVIYGSKSLEDAVWREQASNLSFLPAAKSTSLIHTSEILLAARTKQFFDELRRTYDYVIVDLPPLMPIMDVRATASLIDCFVLVVEWGRTEIDVVRRSLQNAPTIRSALLGFVLNKTDLGKLGMYGDRQERYHSDKYYTAYNGF